MSSMITTEDTVAAVVKETAVAQYFEDWDFERVYACLGTMGYDGVFRLETDPMHWEFVYPNSPTWYGVTERIYMGHRADWISNPEKIASFPPLPPVPPKPYPSSESYKLPKTPLQAANFPNTAQWLRQSDNLERVLWVLLFEDLWETRNGDGKFQYFEDVFETKEETVRFPHGEDQPYKVVSLSVRLAEDGTIEFPGFSLSYAEHYEPEKVLRRFEEKRSTNASRST